MSLSSLDDDCSLLLDDDKSLSDEDEDESAALDARTAVVEVFFFMSFFDLSDGGDSNTLLDVNDMSLDDEVFTTDVDDAGDEYFVLDKVGEFFALVGGDTLDDKFFSFVGDGEFFTLVDDEFFTFVDDEFFALVDDEFFTLVDEFFTLVADEFFELGGEFFEFCDEFFEFCGEVFELVDEFLALVDDTEVLPFVEDDEFVFADVVLDVPLLLLFLLLPTSAAFFFVLPLPKSNFFFCAGDGLLSSFSKIGDMSDFLRL